MMKVWKRIGTGGDNTLAMEIPLVGCLVRTYEGEDTEALAFVPGVQVLEDKDDGNKLVPMVQNPLPENSIGPHICRLLMQLGASAATPEAKEMAGMAEDVVRSAFGMKRR